MYSLILVFIMQSYNAASSTTVPRVGTYQQCMEEGARQQKLYTKADQRGNITQVMFSCARVQ